jgi:dipeptidase E
MKLYLSSIEIPTPDDLAQLLEKSLKDARVAVIPNAQDYYNERARSYKNEAFASVFKHLGLDVEMVDLRDYDDASVLMEKLRDFDLIWARGGNTFCLRYEMRRSGFEVIIKDLLNAGIIYGGDSAGALAAGISIAGFDSGDDTPEFAEEILNEGLNLVPYVVLPHNENPDLTETVQKVLDLNKGKNEVIALKDNQAVIFEDETHRIVEAV